MSAAPTGSSEVRVLDPLVARQVAAGEVVDRPASVVKELVENALDAGASRIEVETSDGGSSRISVSDDGVGMSEADARTAVLSHATSKISSVEDLQAVSTLGFRGEALPSIASVSAFELTTSTGEGGAATKVAVDGGAEAEVSGAARPRGTTVKADRLFFNVPARRAFLKSKQVERAQVGETVMHLAIAHPTVGFALTENGRQQLSLPPGQDLRGRLAGVYGVAKARSFRAVEHESFPYRVTGYAALPSLTYTSRYSCQTVSVNGRWLRGASLMRAVDDAYRGTVSSGRHPPVALDVELDVKKVDVNVHPTKQVVRFSDEPGTRRTIADAVKLAVEFSEQEGGSSSSTRSSSSTGSSPSSGEPAGAHPAQRREGSSGASSGSAGLFDGSEGRGGRGRSSKQERERAHQLKDYRGRIRDVSKPSGGDVAPAQQAPDEASPSRGGGEAGDLPETEAGELPERGALPPPDDYRVIGQFDLGYILLEEPRSALWVVDQHVAHERVLLDRLNEGEQVSVQQLLEPEVVELSAEEAADGRELLEDLSVFGFEAEPFGPQSMRITGVISTLAEKEIAEAFREALAVARGTQSGPDREQRILATVACKSAVKLGDRLSMEEMESLIKSWLTESRLPATCPHGRSICYRVDTREVARKLDRH